jgi:hypothetical protein
VQCFVIVCPFDLFLLDIVLVVLRFTTSDHPFGIFKLLTGDWNLSNSY